MLKANSLQQRLNSFREWRSNKNHIDLASAGFRYSGQNDRVECDICGIRIVKWTAQDNALQCHARLGPKCKFLKEIGLTENYRLAKFPNNSTYEIRLESMSAVPEEFISSLPQFNQIARAGLFYMGSLDRMCCFYCGLVLRDWESTTDPLEVHQQYHGDCFFIVSLASRITGNDKDVSRTLQIVENHLAMRMNSESFTYRLGKLISESAETKSNVDQNRSDQEGETEIEEQHKQMDHEHLKHDILSLPINKTTLFSNLSSDMVDSALSSKMGEQLSPLSSLDEISDEDLFPSGASCLPPSKEHERKDNTSKDEKQSIKSQSTAWARHQKTSPNTLQLPVLKGASNNSSVSSGYGSSQSLSETDTRQEVTDGSKSSYLPPIYSDCNFSELPMVKAVLEAGISFEKIVGIVRDRYSKHGEFFTDASSLMLAILDSEYEHQN